MDDEDFGAAIHARLQSGDPVAPEALCGRWLEPLVGELGRAFPEAARRDPTLIWDAVIQSLLNYAERPGIYQPGRSPLRTSLYFAARADLLNLLDRERRRAARERPLALVEVLPDQRNDLQSDDPDLPRGDQDDLLNVAGAFRTEDDVPARSDAGEYWRLVASSFPEERDRRFVALMLQGERKTGPYAEVLGIGHLDRLNQQREVKRNKDRIGKRLRRLGEKLHDRPKGDRPKRDRPKGDRAKG